MSTLLRLPAHDLYTTGNLGGVCGANTLTDISARSRTLPRQRCGLHNMGELSEVGPSSQQMSTMLPNHWLFVTQTELKCKDSTSYLVHHTSSCDDMDKTRTFNELRSTHESQNPEKIQSTRDSRVSSTIRSIRYKNSICLRPNRSSSANIDHVQTPLTGN